MTRAFFALLAFSLLFPSIALAKRPYYHVVRQNQEPEAAPIDEFQPPVEPDFDMDPALEPEPAGPEPNSAAPDAGDRPTEKSTPRETVAAPAPIEYSEEDFHEGHAEPLWPEYYGPPYGDLGYDPCMPPGAGCSPCGGFLHNTWGQFDYLLWWGKGGRVPPLVTTSPTSVPPEEAGVLGQPGTSILFGNDRLDSQMRSGGRINFGLWFDPCQEFGVGGSFFGAGELVTDYRPTSDGTFVLARPFYNIETGQQDQQLVAYPGFVAGDIAIRTTNSVIGAEAYFREALKRGPDRRLDAIYGYRFVRMDEGLNISDTTISIEDPSIIPLGTTVEGTEYFLTRNMFHGAEFGLWYQANKGRWGWDMLAKIALGTVRQNVYINGQTNVFVPGVGEEVQPGSLYALPTNIGKYARNQFSVVPEFQINLTRCITDHLRFRFGYTFLLMTSVAQTGRQIDPVVNPSQIGGDPLVGPARPHFEFRNTNYWLQGINFGLEYAY